ncbi:MAG: hypothetical protein U0637_07385 [Phycisphaerales bacterium]
MSSPSRRRNTSIAIAILVIAIVILLLTRCRHKPAPVEPAPKPATRAPLPADAPANPAPVTQTPAHPATSQPVPAPPEEVLTPATLTTAATVTAGAPLSVTWTGPNNPGDYIIIVPAGAPAAANGDYQQTQLGATVPLTAPTEPGPHEVRYVTARSHTILGRASVEVTPAQATLTAPALAPFGAPFSVTWTGPDNTGDYITIVPKGTQDGTYGNYALTQQGSPLTLTAPAEAGPAELRYITGQGAKILARRPISISAPEVTITAPSTATAGSTAEVTWTGPDNKGDFITVVEKDKPDGQYGNYTNTASGSPLKLLLPIMAGDAELRYMTGQGAKVLARRPIAIKAAPITLNVPEQGAPGADVSITWTGPANPGDYITIVPKAAPDEAYAAYADASKGSPMTIQAPNDPGEAEVRYVAGQGRKVLARAPIRIIRP